MRNLNFLAGFCGVLRTVFGFACTGVSIRPESRTGTCGRTSQLDTWHDLDTLEHYLISACAGYPAECRFDPQGQAQAYTGAGQDFEDAKKTLSQLGRKWNEAEWISKAEAFVAEHWASINAISKEAVLYQELDHDEVAMIVELAQNPSNEEALRTLTSAFAGMAGITHGPN